MKRKKLRGEVRSLEFLCAPFAKCYEQCGGLDVCPTVVTHTCGLYSTVGVHVQPGMAHWLLEEQLRNARDKEAQSRRAASELEMERRNILNAMRHREPERGGVGP